MPLTSRQPVNAGGFRMLAFTKPANDVGIHFTGPSFLSDML